jgi:hypothetical protein
VNAEPPGRRGVNDPYVQFPYFPQNSARILYFFNVFTLIFQLNSGSIAYNIPYFYGGLAARTRKYAAKAKAGKLCRNRARECSPATLGRAAQDQSRYG